MRGQCVDNRCCRSESERVTMKRYIPDGCYYSSCPRPRGLFFVCDLTIPEPFLTVKRRRWGMPLLVTSGFLALARRIERAFFSPTV
jgi:hypothetical protein